jgi:predicted Fe-S protein YdhL (DUF1289 family)
MSNAPAAPAPVLTPCVGICRLDPRGLCVGCRRSGEEIARWRQMSDEQRRYWMDVVLPSRPPA